MENEIVLSILTRFYKNFSSINTIKIFHIVVLFYLFKFSSTLGLCFCFVVFVLVDTYISDPLLIFSLNR